MQNLSGQNISANLQQKQARISELDKERLEASRKSIKSNKSKGDAAAEDEYYDEEEEEEYEVQEPAQPQGKN